MPSTGRQEGYCSHHTVVVTVTVTVGSGPGSCPRRVGSPTRGGLVESQIRRALDALDAGDPAIADEVIAGDHRVNAMEVALDGDCSHLIVRRQPAAGDLRMIFAITKTVTDLERIGDEAQKIARMAKNIQERGGPQAAPMVQVRHAAEAAISMLRRTLDAFARLDVDTARMTENLEVSHGLIYSQRVLLRLTETGLPRQVAYEIVQRHAMRAWRERRPFLELLLADPAVTDRLSPDELKASQVRHARGDGLDWQSNQQVADHLQGLVQDGKDWKTVSTRGEDLAAITVEQIAGIMSHCNDHSITTVEGPKEIVIPQLDELTEKLGAAVDAAFRDL